MEDLMEDLMEGRTALLAQYHLPFQNLRLLQKFLLRLLPLRQVPQLLRRFQQPLLQGLSVAHLSLQKRHQEGFQLEHPFALLLFVQQMFFFPPQITPHTGHTARLK